MKTFADFLLTLSFIPCDSRLYHFLCRLSWRLEKGKLKMNILTSDWFGHMVIAVGVIFSLVASLFLGNCIAVAGGANLEPSNPFASLVIVYCSILPFVVLLIGNIFLTEWFSSWQYKKRLENMIH